MPAKQNRMTDTQALMIVRNFTSGYTEAKIREAAILVLGSLDANAEDMLDAGNALGYADLICLERNRRNLGDRN